MQSATATKPTPRIKPAGRLRFQAITGGHFEATHNGLDYRYASAALDRGDRLAYEAEVRKPRSRLIIARTTTRTAAEAKAWLNDQAGRR